MHLRTLSSGVLALVTAMSAFVWISTSPGWSQDGCQWFGSRPFCDGNCPAGFVYTGHRESCTTGSRRYCCPTHLAPSGVNCKWVGDPGSLFWACDKPVIRIHLKNNCDKPVQAAVDYVALPGDRGHKTVNLAPGQDAYIGDTKHRYMDVTAHLVGGNRRWSQKKVDLGAKLGHKHTQSFSCR